MLPFLDLAFIHQQKSSYLHKLLLKSILQSALLTVSRSVQRLPLSCQGGYIPVKTKMYMYIRQQTDIKSQLGWLVGIPSQSFHLCLLQTNQTGEWSQTGSLAALWDQKLMPEMLAKVNVPGLEWPPLWGVRMTKKRHLVSSLLSI